MLMEMRLAYIMVSPTKGNQLHIQSRQRPLKHYNIGNQGLQSSKYWLFTNLSLLANQIGLMGQRHAT